MFQHPLALIKLAHFILGVRGERYKKAKNTPLVISVKNNEKKTNLVIAVMGGNRDSETQRNNFHSRFQKAALQCNLAINHHSFDAAMIEIKSQNWSEFI